MNLINFAQSAGLKPQQVAGTQGGEYHCSCPKCGGNDRFYIQPNRKQKNCVGYYRCRQCNIYGDTIQFCREFLVMGFNEAVAQASAVIPQKRSLLLLPKQEVASRPTTPRQPSKQWTITAQAMVENAHNKLLLKAEALAYLNRRGLPIEAVKQYKIGWIETDLWMNGNEWNLARDKVWVPKGILIVVRRNNTVVGLKVRRAEWTEGDKRPKYVIISGSIDGLYIFGETSNRDVMVIVESELDALAVQYAISDFGFAVAIGSSLKNPDILTDYLAKTKKHLLISHDNDDTGTKMLEKWKLLYPHAKAFPTPVGKDIGEAIQQGLEPRAWLLKVIAPNALADTFPLLQDSAKLAVCWNSEDQALVDWTIQYIDTHQATCSSKFYTDLMQEILLGPDSHRAKNGELQNGLRLMKILIQQS